MLPPTRILRLAPMLVAALLANLGCASSHSQSGAPTEPLLGMGEAAAPTLTGSYALDALNWVNYRRAQAGLGYLTRNPRIDTAAQGHASYQSVNDLVTATQIPGHPAFTGSSLADRLSASGYASAFTLFASGESNLTLNNTSGFYAAEVAVTRIYQRFLVFEPQFVEIGAGSATGSSGHGYLTIDLAAAKPGPGIGTGRIISYPFANQTGVATQFFSDEEQPDPVPNQNEVGFPVSVHTDAMGAISVQSFTVTPRQGSPISARLLTNASDAHTPPSAAAIIPLAPLRASTIYDVSFAGTAGGTPVTRDWSFTTK